MAQVIDCCMFYNELEMLELRFNILDPVVDCFVVCEAKKTHSGNPKPLYLADNLGRFKPFHRKLVHVVVSLPDGIHSWERERTHRRGLSAGLETCAEAGDMVIVGDCDEIPNPDILRQIPPQGGCLKLDTYYYNLHTRLQIGWAIGALPYGVENDPNNIRTLAGHNVPVLENAGWHFSYFLSPEGVTDKLDAFMHHADVAKDVPRDPAWIGAKMAAGEDLFGRDTLLEQVPISENLPRYLLDHLDQYPQWTGDYAPTH